MNRLTMIVLSMLTTGVLMSQPTVIHPWHVTDNGGGKSSASGGLVLQASVGQPGIAAMTGASVNSEGGYIPGIRLLGGISQGFFQSFLQGWNMVSVPAIVNDFHKTVLYPTANSPAFSYLAGFGYSVQSIMENHTGYWLKFGSPSNATVIGTSIAQETVAVAIGWNLIGMPSYPVLLSNISPLGGAVITSHYFNYGITGYKTYDTLQPGKSYWAKASQAGQLILQTGSVANPPSSQNPKENSKQIDLARVNSLTFHSVDGFSQTLYFTFHAIDGDMSSWELPPTPPAGVFDVRFKTGHVVEAASRDYELSYPVEISSAAYPLKISWKNVESAPVAMLSVGKKEVRLKGNGEVTISNPEELISLFLPRPNSSQLPEAFGLHQNFPNPFNPTTKILYDLPHDAYVTIVIYDLLGRRVSTVVDGLEEAGYRAVDWNASSVASGVYFYRIHAQSMDGGKNATFDAVKRMMVIK